MKLLTNGMKFTMFQLSKVTPQPLYIYISSGYTLVFLVLHRPNSFSQVEQRDHSFVP